MKKLLWLLVPVAALMISCGGGGSVFPLTVGNEWNYQTITSITFTDTLITDIVDTTTHVSEITAQDTLNNGTDVFEQVTTFSDTLAGVDTSYVLDNGDYVLGYSNKAMQHQIQ